MSSDLGRHPTAMQPAVRHQPPAGPQARREAARAVPLLARTTIAGALGLAAIVAAALPGNTPSSAYATTRTASPTGSTPDTGEGVRPAAKPAAQRAADLRASRGASRGTQRSVKTAAKPAAKAAAKPAAKPAAKALGPRAALARTPAAGSTRTTRVAALAFPDLGRFTWVGPVSGTRQTSGFGQRWGRLHAGLDFAGPVGTPLRAMSSGVVRFAGQQGGYGNKVEILMWDGSLVNYGHMHGIAVKTGQKVVPGQYIGRLGNTGHSTGPHLHLEVRPGAGEPADPWPWLVARGILPPDVPRK